VANCVVVAGSGNANQMQIAKIVKVPETGVDIWGRGWIMGDSRWAGCLHGSQALR